MSLINRGCRIALLSILAIGLIGCSRPPSAIIGIPLAHNSLSTSSGSTGLGGALANTVSAFGATVTNAISE